MIRKLFARLRRNRLDDLRAARAQADKALQAAILRRDTRAIHEARDAMRKATTDLMRAEVLGCR